MSIIKKIIELFKDEPKEDITLSLPLNDHPLYRTIDTYRKFKLTCLNISNPTKRKMAIYYLDKLYANLTVFLKELAVESNIDKYITNLNLISDGMINAMKLTENQCLSNGVPHIFLDRMREFNYKYFDLIMNTLSDIHQSAYYPNNRFVMTSVLDMMLLYIRLMMSNTEVTINNMNGELQAALKGTVFDS